MLAARDDAARRKSDFFADLQHLVPTRLTQLLLGALTAHWQVKRELSRLLRKPPIVRMLNRFLERKAPVDPLQKRSVFDPKVF